MIKTFFKEHKIHKKIAQNMDWIFIFNIPYFFILWMIFSWGMSTSYYSQNISNYSYFSTDITLYQFIFFLGLTLLLGGINIHNQLDDLVFLLDWSSSDSGKYKRQLKYLYVCPNFINIKPAKTCSIISVFIGLLLISMYSFFVLGLLIFYCYLNLFLYKKYIIIDSFKQLILRCFFILLSNFVLFLSGWAYFGIDYYISIIKYAPLFIMAILPIILINEVVSYNNYSNKETEHRIFINNNRKNIAFLSLLLMVSLFFCSYYSSNPDPISSHFSIITTPFLIYTFLRSSNKDYIRSFRYSIMILNILLSWTLFPFLFLAQFIIYYLSKYYYWHRFDIHFPKFIIDENE